MHLLSVFSLRNRALIALITIVVGVFGVIALMTLKQDLFPSITAPQLSIVSTYTGASPTVVDNDVSTPIETSVQGVAGVDTTTATSTSGASTVSVTFTDGTDLTSVEEKIQLAIDQISLPAGVNPKIVTQSVDDIPVIALAVTSKMNAHDLSNALNKSTIDNLQALNGVSAATLFGEVGQRITITPNATKLKDDGFTTQDINTALSNNGVLLASGDITENDQTLVVQSGQQLTSLKQLEAIPLIGTKTTVTQTPLGVTQSQTPIHAALSSVATVALTNDPTTSISRVNGKPALTVSVTETADGNTVAVSKAVRADIPALEKNLGSDTRFTVVFDQAPFIESSINDLAQEGILGLGAAVIIILIFLLSVRTTLVTAISIPVSLLIAFIGMLAAGYTLNIITLGAITIAIGRVVDDSIVVIENIKRHISRGEDKIAAITAGVREVAAAVTASTVTTVAVFLPLAIFVSGTTGEVFTPFAVTVTIALFASLLVALTIVPVLAYWFLKTPKASATSEMVADTGIPDPGSNADELQKPTLLQRAYLPIIRWTIARVWRATAVIGVAVLVLLGTGALAATGIPTDYLGSSGQNTLTVDQTLPLGASLAAENVAAVKVESALRKVKDVDIVQTTIGSGGGAFAGFGGGGGISFSLTTNPKADQDAIQSRVRAAVKGLKGVGTVALQGAGAGFSSTDITITVKARDGSSLRTAAADVQSAVKNLPVTAQATNDLSTDEPYISVAINRNAAAAKGLSELQVAQVVAQAMNPSSSGTVALNDTNLSVYIDNSNEPMTTAALKDFDIPTATGNVKLSSLADVSVKQAPASITTIKGVQSATITVTPKSADTGTASSSIATAIKGVKLPSGASATLGGVTTQQNDAFSQLGIALLAAILIVYIVMVATFKSLRQPLLLLVSVPFAATGAIILQKISGIPLGVASLIGVLMLIGIVVTNAIVLVDLINQYRRRGYRVFDAIVHGASRRLRPILMTALATIFALLPMGVGLTGGGGFISQPLAIVVIGGLVSSTVLTLIVLPVLYFLVEGARERRVDRRARKMAQQVVAQHAAANHYAS
ncbi:MAG: integral rane efflux transporter, family [Glaciihabitans sp.]|nr:integral rane efflux transporter, family [Glaciihabitans sp.]